MFHSGVITVWKNPDGSVLGWQPKTFTNQTEHDKYMAQEIKDSSVDHHYFSNEGEMNEYLHSLDMAGNVDVKSE